MALWASVWSKDKGVGPPRPPGPSLGSTTFVPHFWDLTLCDVECNVSFILHNVTEEGFLKSFIESTKSLSPEEKGAKLEIDEV